MKRPRVDLMEVKLRTICRLHVAIATNEEFDGAIGPLSRDVGFSRLLVELAVDELQKDKLCGKYDGGSGETYVDITREGIETVESWTDEIYFQIVKTLNIPFAEESRKGEKDSNEAGLVPASDRIVTLNDNKPAREKALDAIEKAIVEAEASNEFGHLFADPNERAVVLSEMKSGLAILRDATFARRSTIKNLIADKLTMIVSKLQDFALVELAKKAIEALGSWIGGLF